MLFKMKSSQLLFRSEEFHVHPGILIKAIVSGKFMLICGYTSRLQSQVFCPLKGKEWQQNYI